MTNNPRQPNWQGSAHNPPAQWKYIITVQCNISENEIQVQYNRKQLKDQV